MKKQNQWISTMACSVLGLIVVWSVADHSRTEPRDLVTPHDIAFPLKSSSMPVKVNRNIEENRFSIPNIPVSAEAVTSVPKYLPEHKSELASADFDPSNPETMDPDRLLEEIRKNKGFANKIAKRLVETELSPETRGLWVSGLAQDHPELLARSVRDLLDTQNPEKRREAFDILRSAPGLGSDLTSLAREAALGDSDPKVVARALAVLRDSGQSLGRSFATDTSLAERLREYTQSPDAELRSESISSLVQVDHTQAIEPVLSSALEDENPEVRSTAIQSIVASGIRSPEIKDQIMSLSLDQRADTSLRVQALEALNSFRLEPGEEQLLGQLATNLETLMISGK